MKPAAAAALTPRQRIGAHAEARALRHLQEAGLECLGRNLGGPLGEIDLLMRDGEQWVFVEVRARASMAFGGAAASVGAAKQQRLRRQAQALLKAHFGDRPWPACRFDVCVFDGVRFEWLRNAF